jgi:uncharacterized membrane protein
MSTPRTHPLNVSYLVVGLVFLGLAASWALKEAGVVDLAEVRWLFPLTLVLAGVIGLVAMAAKGLSRRDSEQDDTYPTYDSTYDSTEGEDR